MKKENILEVVEKKIALKTETKFDPSEYYQDREGLFVGSSFEDRILPKAEPIQSGSKFSIGSFKLLKYSTDEAIEAELPKKHIFGESEVCAIIAELIAKQPKGEEGALLSNGYWNLFYTAGFVVCVDWNGDGWFVFAWGRDDSGWSGDFRVFSPATDRS